jgi:putative transposase
MTTKFRNKYRIESVRLNGYDYSRNGAYFITICTKRHLCLFGNIDVETGLRPVSTNKSDKSDNSDISNKTGKKTIRINLSEEGKIVTVCWFDLLNHYSNIILDEFIVMPNHVHGIIIIQNYTGEKQKHGLSEFVRAFKSFSSRRINEFRKSNNSETWQQRYYDHIIHSDNELDRIRKYIKNNPDNWLTDQNCICSNNY